MKVISGTVCVTVMTTLFGAVGCTHFMQSRGQRTTDIPSRTPAIRGHGGAYLGMGGKTRVTIEVHRLFSEEPSSIWKLETSFKKMI